MSDVNDFDYEDSKGHDEEIRDVHKSHGVVNDYYDEAYDIDDSLAETYCAVAALPLDQNGQRCLRKLSLAQIEARQGQRRLEGGDSDAEDDTTEYRKDDREIPGAGAYSPPQSRSDAAPSEASRAPPAAMEGSMQPAMRPSAPGAAAASGGGGTGAGGSLGPMEDDRTEDAEEDVSISLPHALPIGYNPNDYSKLNVSAEIKELFSYISHYRPPVITLDTKLKCFIPDYIPSIGEVDSFIKVPRPDGQDDQLGVTVLDEPAARQSDPTVLELQLRSVSKKRNADPMVVRSIENAEKHPERVQQWIDMIQDLHQTKSAPQVHYSKHMPDIETLMEQWSGDFDEKLSDVSLPTEDIDLSLSELSRVACCLMDIPVYQGEENSIVQSLHCLFSLYSAYNDIPHFSEMKPAVQPRE